MSFLAIPGIGTGLAEGGGADLGCTGAGASFAPLADRDPEAEFPLDGAEGADAGEIALRSEIIFCKLAKASPPDSALCFLVAASTAASIAVRGIEMDAVMDRWVGSEIDVCSGGLTSGLELGESGRPVRMGVGRRYGCEAGRFWTLAAPGESALSRASPLPFLLLLLLLPTFSALALGPRLVPPLMVVVVPLRFAFSPPSLSPREDSELVLERFPELGAELGERPRRADAPLRVELADEGREE